MLELEHGFAVADTRAELNPDDGESAADALRRELHQAGVARAAVSPRATPAGEGYLEANNAVARLAVDRPFVPVARLNGPRDPGDGATSRLRNLAASPADHHTDADDVERYAYGDRFEAFRLDPIRDGLPTPDALEIVADADLPVFVHAGSAWSPDSAVETLAEFGFPIVLSSFGGFPLDRGAMRSALSALDEYDHLYLDTAAVRYRDVLERGLLEHPDRVVFASGAPDAHPNVGVMELLTLDVSEDLMRRAFVKNPARLLDSLAPEV